MRFRPCIDIHNGEVKQIVGGTLTDVLDQAQENFVAKYDAAYYADFYKQHNLEGGHIILLNPLQSKYYEQTKEQAVRALSTYPGGLQVGGGITDENALEFLEAGASHVIVTSYVFKDGLINYENLDKIKNVVGRERLVLDLSCRMKDGNYYVVTDRWQNYTDYLLNEEHLDKLTNYCDEFLIHAVDVEGKASGIEIALVKLLAKLDGIPITYAGGVGSYEHLEQLKTFGQNKLDVTIGSALDLFGGNMEFRKILELCEN